ncbi:MAG: hypothetical protein QOI65_801, partial [Thermoleophilaceae bacterium]|nr:hypothetical protein [Thermoleophilaceae bacterium]
RGGRCGAGCPPGARAEDGAASGRDLDLTGGSRLAAGGVGALQELDQRLTQPLGPIAVAAPCRDHPAVGVEQDRAADVGRQLVEVIQCEFWSESRFDQATRQNSAVPLDRIAWITTVVICVIAAILVLVSGYVGYFFVLLAVAGAAAINLS